MKRIDILDMAALLQKVSSTPPVHRTPLGRQETILAAPMELEGCAPGPMPPPIPLEDQASRLETPPRLSADDQPTVEAPAGYMERVLEMDALAAQDTAGEEMAKLQRRILRRFTSESARHT